MLFANTSDAPKMVSRDFGKLEAIRDCAVLYVAAIGGSAAAKVVIDSLDVEFAKHFNMGHADLVAAFYTEQGHLMAPNMAAAVGRPAITQGLAGMAAMKPELKLTSEMVVANGPVAIDRGTYTFTFTPPGATAPVTDTGKYLVHWQLVGGKWLKAEDIWNSDKEPMMPMQAPVKP